MQVVTLSHDKKVLDPQSRVFARQRAYAGELDALHVFVITTEAAAPLTDGTLSVHPVTGRNQILIALRLFMALYRQVKASSRRGPTIVSIQSPFELGLFGLCVATITRVPLEVQVHGDFYSRPYWREEFFSNRLRAALGLFVLRRASGVRVVSKRINASLIERGILADRIMVLPIEADLEHFFTVTPAPLWQKEQDAVYVLSVGRFAREKNLPLLINAFNQVHATYKHTRLILVGEGEESKAIRSLIATLWPSECPVALYPWHTDIAPIMKAADIYALSSDHEGYAMVLGEAMAAGVPVLTTDVGCVGELVLDQVHGLVVPPRDEVAYSQALNRLVGDSALRHTLGTSGSTTIHTRLQQREAYTKAVVRTWQSLIPTS